MREFLLVLRFRSLGALHELAAFRERGIAKNAATVVLFGGFAFGTFLLAKTTTAYVMGQLEVGPYVYHRFVSLVMYLLFLTMNLGSVIVCIALLYRSADIEFLMALPVRYEVIFLSKLADILIASSGTLLLLGTAFIAGYAWHFGLSVWWCLSAVLIGYFPMLLLAGALGVLVFVGLLRLAVAAGVRQFVSFTFVLYFAIVYLFFSSTNPVQFLQALTDSRSAFVHYFSGGQPGFMVFLPSQWFTEFLYGSVMGMSQYAVSYLLLSLSILLTLFGLAVLEGSSLYYRTWLAVLALRPGKTGDTRSLRVPVFGFLRRYFAGPPLTSILRRDFWLLVREPSQWVHMVLLLVLAGIFLGSLTALDFRITHPVIQAVAFVMVFSFNGFLVATASLRFVFPAVGLESLPFWSVRTSPTPLRRVYWTKLIPMSLAILAFGELLTWISVLLLRNDPVLHAMALATMACVAFTLTALHLGAGAYFATFQEDNAVRIASSQGGSLTFLGALVYLLAVMLVFLVPLSKHFEGAATGRSAVSWSDLPFAVIVGISIVVTGLSTLLGLHSIGKEY